MSTSVHRVKQILRWFESQQQLVFYASSLLFVYEGLTSSSSSSSPLSSPALSPTLVQTVTCPSVVDSCQRTKDEAAQEKEKKEEEEVAEFNNNNIQVTVPWDYSLATIYTNHRKHGHHHHCASKTQLQGNSGDSATVETDYVQCQEDNSTWKRKGESTQPPNGNKNKPQLERMVDEGERGVQCNKEKEEEEKKETKGPGKNESEVEVRMIDFAHVFPSESHDQGYIYGLRHLLTVLERILRDSA